MLKEIVMQRTKGKNSLVGNLTKSESFRYCQFIWNKMVRDYRVHEYYGLFYSLNEEELGIYFFKLAVIREMSEQFGKVPYAISFTSACPFCEYEYQQQTDGFYRACMYCPMVDNWNIGTDLYVECCIDDDETGYGYLEMLYPSEEFYQILKKIADKISWSADNQDKIYLAFEKDPCPYGGNEMTDPEMER